VDDLAIIVVSTNEAHWLRPCLSSVFEHAGDIELDVVVADNESTDGTREVVEREFPAARVVGCQNRGFSHANNRGWLTCDARYALFLNPDTEILGGTFEELVAMMDARQGVGLAGVKQVPADGVLFPTIRRSPNALRMLGEALGSERLPFRAPWLGERELDLSLYEREVACDWTSGSFMLARREALESAGLLDERSFIYGEEPDLCLRMRKAGWRIVHIPSMTILHHAGKAGVSPRMEAQNAVAKLHYARKHFGRSHRLAFVGTLALRYALRAGSPGRGEEARQRRTAAVRSLRTMARLEPPPFGNPPPTALAPESSPDVEARR
jgi:GT2 family glycosyltransferase